MNSAKQGDPHTPEQLWASILPSLEQQLERVASLIPPERISPEFQNAYVAKAKSTFFSKVGRKTDFEKWVVNIKDWERWANRLIPYRKINPEYVKEIWDELCYVEQGEKRPSGLAPTTVRRVLFTKPNDLDRQEFLDVVLNETLIRFMKYYFSSFEPPMERWLLMQAEKAARDFVQDWVPGLKIKDKKLRPKRFVSIIKKRKDDDDEDDSKGSEEITLPPKVQPCDHWLLTRYAFTKHYNSEVKVISILHLELLKFPQDIRPYLRRFLSKLITEEEIRYAQEHKPTCSSCTAFLERLDFYMKGVVYEAARPFIEEFEETELIRHKHGLPTETGSTKVASRADHLGRSILGKLKTLKETLDAQGTKMSPPAELGPVTRIRFTSPINFTVPDIYADVETINRREATRSEVNGRRQENYERKSPTTIFPGSFESNQITEKLETDQVPVVRERMPMTDTGAVERALRAQQEAQELRQLAIKELLEQQEEINLKLAQLGHAAATPRRGRLPKTSVVATSSSRKTCKVCGELGHNARRHKGKKKAGEK